MEKRVFKKVLITGMGGSGGSYLADFIVENHPQVEVHGLVRWHSTTANHNLEKVAGRVRTHECDMTDFSSLWGVLQDVRPDAIFHLASYSNVRTSFQTPLSVVQNNVMITANLLEAVRAAGIDPVIQLCSTSEVYGQVRPEEVPIREDNPFRPSSPYAASKAAQDLLGFSYFRSYQMKIIRTRMFTYINPRRRDIFATIFAYQVARIEAGLQDVLLHGNLDSVRTIIDVRDAMNSYWMALERCSYGEAYNIGGTTTMTVGEFLQLLIKQSRVPIRTKVDPSLLRPADVTLQIPCVDKFRQATGWEPRHSFEDSFRYLLECARREVEKEKRDGEK
ncbi:MAG TPA: GDP-mannose 4,6-dehydratase [Elusimicrobiota bacterium]|nr:GDP-mannose 4,6-dehydratase [Elusimicrobiota bacterium]